MSERKLLIDSFLKRQIDNPSPYEGMIPAADGRRINFESPQQYSDTFDTLSFMAKWAETYHRQMARIAPLLEGRTRKETADNIFRFLYSSFQYSIDGQLQQLYNPASAWKNRFSGIDCKSYSIIASAILQNLGIPHAFRMVKQPGVRSGNEVIIDPEAWTHVYVVAFSDDGRTYFTIDATTHDNKEVRKTEKYDLMIKNLKHVGLSSPVPIPAVPIRVSGYSALGCNCGNCGHPEALGISLGDITSIIGSLSCIGGSAYKSDYLQRNMAYMNSRFAGIVNKINSAVSASNMDALSSAVAEFKVTANLIHTTYVRKKGSKDWNSCSKRNFDATIKAATFFKDKCGQALEAWVNEYYVKGAQTSSLQLSNEGWEDGFSTNTGMWGMKLTPWITVTEPKYSYSIKNYVRQVPAFAISEYLVQIEKSGTSFNLGTFLQGLTTIAGSFQGSGSGTGSGNGTGTGTGSSNGTGNYTDDSGGQTPGDKKMSTETKLAIGAAGAALAFFLFQPSTDTKTLEKQYRQSNRPAKRMPAKTKKR